ncbi:MAG: NAD(P)-dependent alcohol dehydrogenase [Cyclobacteriaceae bacterium]|nr:NAD(P)-dependent alcohol dehydrogenase [Cyclobacteriaceae bacterium SS2]
MKAIVNKKYGSPDILELREVARPEPKSNEILIRVLAASVNKADWHILNGKPYPVRLMSGLMKPKYQILGADVAGVVERVGAKVTQFRPGDEVYGDLSGSGFGGFAEFVVTSENFIAKKPSSFTYEQAAALPMAAVTALQGLRNKGGISQGDEVLINGASGGVGSFAVQIAKAFGAHVTAVCSTQKVDLALQQGADIVVDYKKDDFTRMGKSYDLIFDTVANHSIRSTERVLKKGGSYIACAFSPGAMFLGPWYSVIKGKVMTNMLASTNQADLQYISKLAEEGKLKPVIQDTFTLDDVPDALKMMAKGSLTGKLVISM